SCVYMVISMDLMRKIDLSKIGAKGYAFVPELKYLLYKAGATFFEVPIIFIERIEGKSKISIKIILEGVINPWKIVFRK
ncbi:dolichyl-phosphate beta-D-mannosyltransferase, partial [Candidatus Nomurabacteria bacterium CG_4_9_14_0_2_um_filter_32_10]